MNWIDSNTMSPPKDGTPILVWMGDWKANLWMVPQIVVFGVFHPNSPGKPCWRNPIGGNKIGEKGWEPRWWMPVPHMNKEDDTFGFGARVGVQQERRGDGRHPRSRS